VIFVAEFETAGAAACVLFCVGDYRIVVLTSGYLPRTFILLVVLCVSYYWFMGCGTFLVVSGDFVSTSAYSSITLIQLSYFISTTPSTMHLSTSFLWVDHLSS
jgi:hypothetical protein